MKKIAGGITAPKGFKANGVYCGIKKSRKKDLMLVVSDTPCSAVGVLTTNQVKASCVDYNGKILRKKVPVRAIIANSGNANCLTGKPGIRHTEKMAASAAARAGLRSHEVLVASTGMIGVPLPISKISEAIPGLVDGLKSGRAEGTAAAQAILTTDRWVKEQAVKLQLGGREVRIGAIAKGAGMIHPEMTADGMLHATMLCFIATDANVAPEVMRSALDESTRKSFNMISVDGDKSTNDMALLLANGAARNRLVCKGTPDAARFKKAVGTLCMYLAKEMIKDGEGATKFVQINVKGAKSGAQARSAAMAAATSNLVKTALYGCDPNWGRIAAAVGSSDADVDPLKLQVFLGRRLVLNGNRPVRKQEAELSRIFKKKNIGITIDLGLGKKGATVWTSDLSTQYVKINSDYRT